MSFRRVALFVLTNLAVVLLLGIVVSLFGLDRYLTSSGLNVPMLLVFAAVFGFGGAFISLWMSKRMALWSTGARVIETPADDREAWLKQTVEAQARQVGIGMPDVAIYASPAPNAFATGARRDASLVAVSTGLLDRMNRREVEAVLAHEVSHVANGDMVTMTLLQGVLNTFVIALSRVVGLAAGRMLGGDDEEDSAPSPMVYFFASIVSQVLFGALASLIVMAFSRHREFRADAGAAELVGADGMIAALERLRGGIDEQDEGLPAPVAAFGIRSKGTVLKLFSSHPPIEDRIAALRTA